MFKVAKPIWLKGLSGEMNIQARLVTEIFTTGDTTLNISGATVYKVRLDGVLVHYGPSPAATDYARVDTVALKTEAGKRHTLEIEAAGYNVPCYASVNSESFIIAEVLSEGEVIAYTGRDFTAYRVCSRVREVLRYSLQRHFSEVWDLNRDDEECEIEILPKKTTYLERRAPLPSLDKECVNIAFCKDKFTYNEGIDENTVESTLEPTSEKLNPRGFDFDSITRRPLTRYLSFGYSFSDRRASLPLTLTEGEYAAFSFAHNSSSLLAFKGRASRGSRIFLAFSESLDGDRLPTRLLVNNVIDISRSGEVDFESFEIHGFMHCVVFVVKGSLELFELSRVKVRNSLDSIPRPNTDDPELLRIYDAAIESFRCNSLGIFMDCPSRERAGWLCDSTYIARAAYSLMGNTKIEEDFLENYKNHKCKTIPEGMVPMCYPAEHVNGRFIPQWSMWLIIEIFEYKEKRFGDAEIYKPMVYGLLRYFERFENELGLLESLESWNFVEWSRANEWCEGVNFPTNMLYAYTLSLVSRLFCDASLSEKAEKIRKTIREYSFDGKFFRDQATRDSDGKLALKEHISEACQYYAFYFGTADEREYKELVDTLLEEFGPDSESYPEIEKANALMGIYLRIDLLMRWGRTDICLEEIKGYFLRMADLTGTLWEHKHTASSLNHGFPSYIASVLLDIFGK